MDFPATRWTLVSQLTDPDQVGPALGQLCTAYWGPIHAYLRQSGQSHAEAQDVTQDFLGMVVRQRLLERADPASGRLRSWLLAALQNFLLNARRHGSRQKRGAGAVAFPLDDRDILPELDRLTAPGLSPDEAFDRAWVAVLLRRVLETLTRQYRQAGREQDFQALLPWLLDGATVPQAEAAAAAGMTVANFRVQLHRLRGRYREALHREIAATLTHEADCQEELEYLLHISGRQT